MSLPVAMFSGQDLLIFFLIIAFWIAIIFAVVRFARTSAPARPESSPAARLQKLEGLNKEGLISEVEYKQQRQRILSEI